MVLVNRLRKYSHFVPLKHPFTAVGVVDQFIKEVVWLHNIPKSILSDRDKAFYQLVLERAISTIGHYLTYEFLISPVDGWSD